MPFFLVIVIVIVNYPTLQRGISINHFITRHSTEARATMSLSQTEKECLKSILQNVNGRSSPTARYACVRNTSVSTSLTIRSLHALYVDWRH